MSNNIIIRKASKDYVCDKCGHKILAGTEYLDRVILNVGKVIKHERYHDECPECNPVVKLFSEIVSANFKLPAAHKAMHTKIWVTGITGNSVTVYDWEWTTLGFVDLDQFLKEYRW